MNEELGIKENADTRVRVLIYINRVRAKHVCHSRHKTLNRYPVIGNR